MSYHRIGKINNKKCTQHFFFPIGAKPDFGIIAVTVQNLLYAEGVIFIC